MRDLETSENGRALTYADISQYLSTHKIENLQLCHTKDVLTGYYSPTNPINLAINDLKKNDGKQDFIKKIIAADKDPFHANVVIYGVCNGEKFWFTLETDIGRSVIPYVQDKGTIEFLLSDIHADGWNCGVFAIECCKHLNLDDFRKILSNKQQNLTSKSVLGQEVFSINTISLPAGLQKYDQKMSNDQIKALQKQNPEEYEKLINKIKKKNFEVRKTEPNDVKEKYNQFKGDDIFTQFLPESLMNKAASYKRKKITSTTDEQLGKQTGSKIDF